MVFESISSMYNILFYIVTFVCFLSLRMSSHWEQTSILVYLAMSRYSPAFGPSKVVSPTNSMNTNCMRFVKTRETWGGD